MLGLCYVCHSLVLVIFGRILSGYVQPMLRLYLSFFSSGSIQSDTFWQCSVYNSVPLYTLFVTVWDVGWPLGYLRASKGAKRVVAEEICEGDVDDDTL